MVNKKNILVTGSKGQLGTSIRQIKTNHNFNFFFKEKKDLDITNYNHLRLFVSKNSINTIINCAAYTKVDEAEKNKDIADQINNQAVENIAKICSELSVQLVHVSTDYVFDGCNNVPYKETCDVNPVNFYGMTKSEGEKKIMFYNPKKSVIIRTSWLYSNKNPNFLNKIIFKLCKEDEIFVVDDEISSPTNCEDLARTIIEIIPKIANNNTEVYHFSNLGFCSRYEFAKKINEFLKLDCNITPTKTKSSKIMRPSFSALNCSKIINDFHIKINPWQTSLKNHLNKTNYNKHEYI